MIIKPFQAQTRSPDTTVLLQQLNLMKDMINQYTASLDSTIGTIKTDIDGITTDSIMAKCTIARVTGDYDLTYSDDGEITTDG